MLNQQAALLNQISSKNGYTQDNSPQPTNPNLIIKSNRNQASSIMQEQITYEALNLKNISVNGRSQIPAKSQDNSTKNQSTENQRNMLIQELQAPQILHTKIVRSQEQRDSIVSGDRIKQMLQKRGSVFKRNQQEDNQNLLVKEIQKIKGRNKSQSLNTHNNQASKSLPNKSKHHRQHYGQNEDMYDQQNYVKLKQLLQSKQTLDYDRYSNIDSVQKSVPDFQINPLDLNQPLSQFNLYENERAQPYFQNLMVRSIEGTNASQTRAQSRQGVVNKSTNNAMIIRDQYERPNDKFLGERLKEVNLSPKRIEDVIKERRIERTSSASKKFQSRKVTLISKFASKDQKNTLYKRLKNLKENKIYDGYNSANSDALKLMTTDERMLEVKPVQHPENLHEKDTNIVSYKVPPKNLTPYYSIPVEALAQQAPPRFESPQGAKHLDVCILGAPNAGKSSIINFMVDREISAVSNKYNTTDEAVLGLYTDYDTKCQLAFIDTPGITKANNSMKSKILVTKAWDKIGDSDMVMFVVDSVKKIDFEVKEAIKRLKQTKIDPQHQKILDALQDDSFTDEKFSKGFYEMTEQEKEFQTYNIPSLLILNKVDLVTNKGKLRDLQNELEDLGNFEKIFHVSALSGFGLDTLREYLKSRAKLGKWEYHPELKSKQSEVEKVEEAMKQAIYEKFFKELPYQVGIKCVGWVPKLNGELRIDVALDVKNDVQKGMLLGEHGRIIRQVRERATQLLVEKIQRPVSMFVEVKIRRNEISSQNKFDSMEGVASKKRVESKEQNMQLYEGQ
eukprot:403343883